MNVCMYVLTSPPRLLNQICMSPRSYHGTLNKKYLTDRSIFAKDMLNFNTSPIQINVF